MHKKVEQENPKEKELELKVAELINDLQRTRADFENYRKQTEIQKENEKISDELSKARHDSEGISEAI